jgi:predicted phage terminase large subunit-like protein
VFARQLLADGRLDAELARRAEQRQLEDERLRLEGSLIDFVEAGWSSVDGSQYSKSWAIDALCEHLTAVTNDEISRLLINFPPRCGKTLITSVCWPAWTWARRQRTYRSGAGVRFLAASYGHSLSVINSTLTRRLVLSPWYQQRWGDRFQFAEDQNTKSRFDLDTGGSRLATSVGGTLLGVGGDVVVLDDPHNTEGVESEAERETTRTWWAELSTTRLNDPRRAAVVVIMQRLHEDDISGKILSDGDDSWTTLMIPMEYESRRHCVTSIGWQDPRGLDDDGEPLVNLSDRFPRDDEAAAILDKRENTLMWPERFGAKEVAALKAGLGPYMSSGRLQQSPAPKGGGIFNRDWWGVWESPNNKFPPCEFRLASVDCAFTESEENDPSALTVWGVYRNQQKQRRIVLMHAWRKFLRFSAPKVERLSVPTVVDGVQWPADEVLPGMPEAVVQMRNKNYVRRSKDRWGLVEWIADSCRRFDVHTLLVEAKASGLSAAQELRNRHGREGWSIITMPTKGDEVARALAAQPTFSQGMISAPVYAWADMVINEMATFPKGRHDDLTDSATQAINYLRSVGLARSDDESADDEVKAALPPRRFRPVYNV